MSSFSSSNNDKAHFERYLNYVAFLSGCQSVTFSYASNDSNGGEQQLSPYVQEIQTHFQIKDQSYSDRPQVDEPSAKVFRLKTQYINAFAAG